MEVTASKVELVPDETFKYVPKVCRVTKEGDPEVEIKPTFEGCLILRQPTLEERYGRFAAIEHLRETSNTKFLLELVVASKDMWKGVQLKHLKTGKEYTSYEQLIRDPKCDKIIFDVATGFIDGFEDEGLGN